MRWSEGYRYWINTDDYKENDISSFLRVDVASMDLWRAESGRWTHYPYQMTPEEVLSDHDKEISESDLRSLAPSAFVPRQLDRKDLYYDEEDNLYMKKHKFDSYFGYVGYPEPTRPEQIFWNFAEVDGLIPQSLVYFYLEQEGEGWVLDPHHNKYRNQNPEYCCQSASRTICSKSSPIGVLKRHLEELGFEKQRVSFDDFRKSLEPFPCLLLDYRKFIYFIFKLIQDKFVVFSRNDQGQKFLQKSFYEAPRKGRPPNYLKK